MAVVNYEYHSAPGKKYHSVNYITRATFTDYNWDPELAKVLYNFRNTRCWGVWDSVAEWKLEDGKINFESIIKFEKNVCPFCGGHLSWSKVQSIEIIDCMHESLLPITVGYYLLM